MKKYLISGSLMISALVMVVACGKKDDGGGAPAATPAPAVAVPVTGAGTTPGTCSTGYLYDARYNCLPQGSCQPGSAYYQDRCILVQVSNVGQGNCVLGSPDYYTCVNNGGNNFVGNGFIYQGGNFVPYNGSTYQQPYPYYGYGNPYYNGNPYYGSSYSGSVSGSFRFRYGYGY